MWLFEQCTKFSLYIQLKEKFTSFNHYNETKTGFVSGLGPKLLSKIFIEACCSTEVKKSYKKLGKRGHCDDPIIIF